MKLNVETPTSIVDINSLSELSGIRHVRFERTGRSARLARMSDVAADPRLIREYPALSESLWRAASQQLRNMASLGGNLLQRTRCAYFRGGEPFACNKRKPGSGCAAQEGINRGHALLGGSEACIAVYPGDLADRSASPSTPRSTCSVPDGERTIRCRASASRAGQHATYRDSAGAGRIDLAHSRARRRRSAARSTYHKIRDRESYAFALASAAVALQMDGDTVQRRAYRHRRACHASVAGPRGGKGLVGKTLTPRDCACGRRRCAARGQGQATTTASGSSLVRGRSPMR